MTEEITQERNCAFQYAKITGEVFRDTKIVCDETDLTMDQAKELWNKYYPDLAKHIKNGNTGEMALWIGMVDSYSYNKTLQHISTDAESDGVEIWQTKKEYFTKKFKIETTNDH